MLSFLCFTHDRPQRRRMITFELFPQGANDCVVTCLSFQGFHFLRESLTSISQRDGMYQALWIDARMFELKHSQHGFTHSFSLSHLNFQP